MNNYLNEAQNRAEEQKHFSNRCPKCNQESRFYRVCPKCHVPMERFALESTLRLKDKKGNEFIVEVTNSSEALRKNGMNLSMLQLAENGEWIDAITGEAFERIQTCIA